VSSWPSPSTSPTERNENPPSVVWMWNPFAVASVVPATTKVNYYCVMEGAVVRHTLSASGYRRCLRGGGTVRPVTPMSMLLEHAYEPVIMETLLVASGSANAPVLMTATRVKVGTLHCPFCRSMLLPWCVCACCTNDGCMVGRSRTCLAHRREVPEHSCDLLQFSVDPVGKVGSSHGQSLQGRMRWLLCLVGKLRVTGVGGRLHCSTRAFCSALTSYFAIATSGETLRTTHLPLRGSYER